VRDAAAEFIAAFGGAAPAITDEVIE